MLHCPPEVWRVFVLGYWLDTSKEFNFRHSTWEKIHFFARSGAEIRQRTIYNRIQADYITLLRERFGNNPYPLNGLIFEVWYLQQLHGVVYVSSDCSFLEIERAYFTEVGKSIYAPYAALYELINFGKHNSDGSDLYDSCLVTEDVKAFNQ